MARLVRLLSMAMLVAFAACPCFGLTEDAVSRACIVLATDGSGDYGPQTPGTRTNGWQEALAACVSTERDLYVQGGFGGRRPIFHIHETIRFPAAQDFRIDGGGYALNWEGPLEDDLLVIDSAMNCEYHLGLLVYGGREAALRIRPEKPVPIDGFPAWVESQLFCQTIADPQPFQPGERQAGTGVVLDASLVAICHSDFYIASVLNFRTCIELRGDVSHSDFRVPHLHTNADCSTLMVVGEKATGNHLWLTLGVDQGARDVTGLVLGGVRNVVELGQRGSNCPIPPGRALILAETAEGNQVNIIDTLGGRPEDLVTDSARAASNQLTWAGPALLVRELTGVGADFTHTQRLYPATIRWSGGQVERATLIRGEQRIDLGPGTDREWLLSVGDALRLESAAPPAVLAIPVKVR